MKLNRKSMGCLDFPVWIGISIGCVVVVVVVVGIVINRKWEAIKFLMFMKFDLLVNDDPPEKLSEMEFDAFVAYRCVFLNLEVQCLFMHIPLLASIISFCSHKDKPFMKDYVQRYLEQELGYRLCFHERDFLVGESILANIEAAINHSRRMIMIISRYDTTCFLVRTICAHDYKKILDAVAFLLSEIQLLLGGF